jgi:hypothetical protein
LATQILNEGGGGGALAEGTSPGDGCKMNVIHIQGKCNLTATQTIQDSWDLMVNIDQSKIFSSAELP